jgi:hypothetical protein
METHPNPALGRPAGSRRRVGGTRIDRQLGDVYWHIQRRGRMDGRGRRAAVHARAEIEAAIMLVAGGHFPRVLISNLVDCTGAVRDLRGLADAAGVDLELLPRSDGRGCDIAVSTR